MEKRLWIAMILSFLLILLYQSWMVKKRGVPLKPVREAPTQVVEKKPPLEVQKIENVFPSQKPREIKVEHPLYTAVFTTQDASLKSFKLKKYHTTLEENSPLVELVNNNAGINPLSTPISGELSIPEHTVYSTDHETLLVGTDGALTFFLEEKDKYRVEKRFKFFPDSYLIELSINIFNLQNKPLEHRMSILWDYHQGSEHSRYQQISAIALMGDSVSREALKEGQEKELRGDIVWFGMDMHYFLAAILPERKEGLIVQVKLNDRNYFVNGNYQPIVIPANGMVEYNFKLFMGPKEIGILESAGHKLDKAINLGWFHAIGYPLLVVLKWLYGIVSNYGIAIIILTILVRIIFFPLSISSFRSMKKMQIIQPELKEIQKKYANDREKLSREIWELYRRHKVNPLGGCLPMLIQIPVFIALYQVLMNAIELRHAPFILWMNDLSAPDLLLTIPLLGYPFPLRVLPILMGVSMYVQQKMTPMAGDPQQIKIMMWMPAILTVMLYGLPSGLTLYWTVSNLLSIIQQWYINSRVKV